MHIYLSLGSNIGHKKKNLLYALKAIETQVGHVEKVSSFIETKPQGFKSNNLFLNAAAEVVTTKPIGEVLLITQQIEKELGRTQKSHNGIYADRIIDIDLLLADSPLIYHSDELILPHPHLAERHFVLQPLAQIAPDLRLPCGDCIEDILLAFTQPRTYLYSLNESDLTDINNLLHQLSTTAQPLTVTNLSRLNANPSTSIYATRDKKGRLVGMITLCLCESPTGCKAWAEDLVVDKNLRGSGMGHALISRAEREARRRGAKSFNFTSRPQRERANDLYVKMDYERRDTNIYRRKFQ